MLELRSRRLAVALPFLTLLCALVLGGRASAAPVEPAERTKKLTPANVDPKKALAQEKAKGKAFVDKMAKQKGAIRTKSGMVYIPLKAGSGPTPTATDTVKVDQTAATIDGKVFDESPIGKGVEVRMDKVIPCWREGIQMIKVGGKAKLVCPPELAFGDNAAPDHFPAGATIVYDIELWQIVKK